MNQESCIYTPDEMMMLGMDCLVKEFGIINAEMFISSIRGSCPDYTIWRRRILDDITEEEMDELIRHSLKGNPFESEFEG